MQLKSNKLELTALLALTGLATMSTVAGCGSDVSTTSTTGVPQGPKCGNAIVEGDETCDDGNDTSGDGCEADCSYSCDNTKPDTGNVKCDDANPCNGAETCGDSHACVAGMKEFDGVSCGTGKICIAGGCQDEICGDGFVNSTEECDDGNMADGDGCNTCKFSCVSDDPARDCSNLDPCVGNKCDDTTHTCGNPISAGDACALSSVCVNGACSLISCGNKIVEPGESCDDGNVIDGDGCQADCTLLISGSICGNGIREAGESCDDSNTKNLDGCDSACKFEQVLRSSWLHMQFGTEAPFCPANALGGSISAAAQGQIQMSLDTGIQDGSISTMFKIMGLNDLSGNSDPFVEIGFLTGTPVAGAMYDGTNDLEWWYTISAATIDANRNPLDKLTGYISGKTLYGGPGNVSLSINFAGIPATLRMSNAQVIASIGAVSTPLMSSGTTPGHRAIENLDPALQSYASHGSPDDTGAGRLCGNVSATSLNAIPVPPALTMGMLACDEGYTSQNTLLDIIVGGCKVFGFVNVITATQPDQSNPAMPVAGAGAPYTFTTNSMTKKVNGCLDKNNQTVDLNMCRNAAAYSGFFKFAMKRVIAK